MESALDKFPFVEISQSLISKNQQQKIRSAALGPTEGCAPFILLCCGMIFIQLQFHF